MSAREELLALARRHMWAAWQLSSEELASQAAATLDGLGMLVPEGGAQELERLRGELAKALEQAAVLPVPVGPRTGDRREQYAAAVLQVKNLAGLFADVRAHVDPVMAVADSEMAELRARVAELEALRPLEGRERVELQDRYARALAPLCSDPAAAVAAVIAVRDHEAEWLLRDGQRLQDRGTELEAEREKLVRWHGEDSKTINRLVARVERHRARLTALQNDALSMRGSLAPSGEDRKVPFELGETLTPAVDWLIARVAELEAERHTTNEALDDAVRAPRETQAAPVTVYRAEHPESGITLGHYGTEAAARAHCEATERNAWPAGTLLGFGWIRDALPEDDENGIAELVVTAGQNGESTTGYIVTALEVPSEYDPDGDE